MENNLELRGRSNIILFIIQREVNLYYLQFIEKIQATAASAFDWGLKFPPLPLLLLLLIRDSFSISAVPFISRLIISVPSAD